MASAPDLQPSPRLQSCRSLVAVDRSNRGPLHLWHLLSLDAPTVAALWTYFLAAANHVALPWTSIAAMATAVWLLYAGDRLLDAHILVTHPDTREGMEARHRFHHRHRRYFRLGIAAAALLLAALLPTLAPEAIRLYLIEGSFLAGYFLLIHATPGDFRLPKEFAVGLFFAAAVFIPTIARAPAIRSPLLVPALLLAALCTLNCLYIYAWEHPTLTPADTHLTTRLALRHLRTLSVTVFFASLAVHTWVTLAIAVALVALLILHQSRGKLSPTTLRAAADLALLTPLLFLPFR